MTALGYDQIEIGPYHWRVSSLPEEVSDPNTEI
jgi:hypothetical protein